MELDVDIFLPLSLYGFILIFCMDYKYLHILWRKCLKRMLYRDFIYHGSGEVYVAYDDLNCFLQVTELKVELGTILEKL